MTTTTPMTATSRPGRSLRVNGTRLHIVRRGAGAPLLLVHGGGEDASMLGAQAAALAKAGYDVVTYDRRGTGRSGRDDWPASGAAQHADDAAALIRKLRWSRPTVVGVSSGAVIALELATRRPHALGDVIAWEPPAAGIVPGGDAFTAAIMAPVEAHLAAHPGDFVGAQAVMLTAIVGFPVTVDDPAFAATRANAEPMVRDEPTITLARIDLARLATSEVTIALGSAPNELIAAAVGVLASAVRAEPVRVDAEHEVYLTDPDVLTRIVTAVHPPAC